MIDPDPNQIPLPLPTTDYAASQADKTVGEILTAGEDAAESAIITAQPWMGTVIIKQIWEGLLGAVFSIVNNTLGLILGYIVIDFQKYVALNNAANTLVQLQAAQKSGDADAIAKANVNMDAAVAPVLHFIGVIKSS